MLGSSLATPSQPPSASARSISRRKSSSTQSTPSSPAQATPHRCGRPISTARAPSASALMTSTPRRKPPSIRTGALPPTASTIARQRADRGDRAVELAAAVIGDDDCVGAAVHRLARFVGMQQALDHERPAPLPAQPFDVAPADVRVELLGHQRTEGADRGPRAVIDEGRRGRLRHAHEPAGMAHEVERSSRPQRKGKVMRLRASRSRPAVTWLSTVRTRPYSRPPRRAPRIRR